MACTKLSARSPGGHSEKEAVILDQTCGDWDQGSPAYRVGHRCPHILMPSLEKTNRVSNINSNQKTLKTLPCGGE